MVPWYSGINGDAPVIAKALRSLQDIEHWKDCLGKIGEQQQFYRFFKMQRTCWFEMI